MLSPAFTLPLAAAMLYALAALFLNAAGKAGINSRISTATCNLFLALFFLSFYDWSVFPAVAAPVWPILLVTVFFVLGQGFTILALSIGEVSIVSPVMGLKVIVVNVLLAAGLREPLPLKIWIAALFSVAGVIALQASPGSNTRSPRAFPAIGCAFLSAIFFAALDVVIQTWSPELGFSLFVPPAMVLAALFSLIFILPDLRKLQHFTPTARKNLISGGLFLAGQSMLLMFAIARYQQVAQTNIIYSSRGIWSVLFVWLLGHVFSNTELKNHSKARLIYRMIGAALISIAIALAV